MSHQAYMGFHKVQAVMVLQADYMSPPFTLGWHGVRWLIQSLSKASQIILTLKQCHQALETQLQFMYN